MPRLRRNEWNFAYNAASLISEALQDPSLADSPLGRAEPELTEFRGARRLDLVIFSRDDETVPLVTGELKVPWNREGRTPYNSTVIEDAHAKASAAGALYFLTWNVRRVVVWKTDDPGVELQRRVVYDREMVPTPIRSERDLGTPAVREALAEGVRELVDFLTSMLTGPPTPTFLPLDRLFITRIEAALDYPIEAVAQSLQERMSYNFRFRAEVERWMRERQGWVVSRSTEEENVERAARFSCYVLVNRLCFYNALRRKYADLPRLRVANNITTGALLQRRLRLAFGSAERYTGDYETVFDEDFGDQLPFMSDDAVPEWRSLIRSLDYYDFAHIALDVIGSMYEQLIRPEERRRYGQHYTQPTVVDLMNSFAIETARSRVLDPGCGGGTFLVRAYARKRYLEPTQGHAELLETIYGCDILRYACHLSTINLAVRDLIDEDNFPRIHQGDFLRFTPGAVFFEQPIRLQAGGLATGRQEVRIDRALFDAVVGNPPYVSARLMRAEDRRHYNEVARRDWPGYDWSPGADIYTYFWTYATTFLKPDGMLVLITQAAWLDVEYGFPVQHWMLENFTILAIMESEAEPWFTDARVATAVTVLKREPDATARNRNVVRFVQFRNRLEAVFGAQTEDHRLRAVERIRDAILTVEEDQATEQWRVRVVPQSDLLREGLNPQGGYVGSKWGRYLRSIDSIFELQRSRRDRFVELQTLAPIRRGITTNCDDFFLVSDISQPALQRHQGEAAFRQAFGVGRGDVGSGRIAIIRRSDGHEAALERDYLCPVVKTARDFRWFATRHMGVSDVAVVLPENRSGLSQLAQEYVRAGEREGWHRNPSFESIRRAGGRWFSLREPTVAQILFVKTMQYTPVVLLNDGGFLANQRLYEVTPITGVDGRALCALLNSTVFAAERYAAVKALGREAAIDVEVFSARRFRTPDLRRLPDEQASRLAELMDALGGRQAGRFLEAALVDTSLTAARRYVHSHRVSMELWPAELRDETRQEIDKLTLAVLGFREREIPRILNRLWGEVVEYTRKLRMLELEAQINRQGAAAQGPNARQLADDVWAHLLENAILRRSVPDDFVRNVPTRGVHIPPGRVEVLQRTLFAAQEEFACTVGRTRFEFGSAGEREYFALLSRLGCVGDVRMPEGAEDCARVATQVQTYIDLLSREFGRVTAEITTDVDLQRRIVREGLRRVIPR